MAVPKSIKESAVGSDLSSMTVEELNALSNQLDRERAVIMVKKRAVAEARSRRLAAEHAAYYGLTSEQYAEAKAESKASGQSFPKLISKARKDRAVQIAKASMISISGQAKGA